MPDIFSLISKWWKQIFAVVVLSLLIAGAVVFIKPPQYLSVATAVPASSVAADKSRIFSQNIEALYSNLGTSDDLDVIVGTGQLDTIYLSAADQFGLAGHYKISGKKEKARLKAAKLLKKNTEIQKSGYGELKVKVWDVDKDLAPKLANALMEKLQSIHRDLQSESNIAALNDLKAGMKKISDSIVALQSSSANNTDVSEMLILKDQLQKYRQLVGEYQLMVDSKPPALLIVENARESIQPDRPKRLEVLVATLVLSFLFGLGIALILERRKIQ